MTVACAICTAHARPDRWACTACQVRLDTLLADIGGLHARLDAAPRGGATASRGAPGFRSSPAASLDVVLLTDPRTRMSPEDRWAAATINVLSGWGCHGSTVAALVHELRQHLDRLTGYGWVDELHRALVDHHRELQRVHGELAPSVSIGPCPVYVITEEDDDASEDEVGRVCRGRIRAEAWGTVATCSRCGCVWRGREQWHRLGDTLGPAEMDAAELARYFGHDTASTVRTWASRDRWPRRRRNGRTLYRLDAALQTWARLHPAEAAAAQAEVGTG
jgi:hypothetical protein